MKIDIRRYRRALWSVIGASLLSGPVTVPVFAQSAIEEIVVTARKREESIQDVPVAVTALNQALIERQAMENLADVSRYMPNVTLGDGQFTAGQLTAAIRGTNFSEVEKSFESSVGIIIDGMFLGTGTGASVQMLDVETVEVLRGPQGTLYGRNTIGGTVNIRRTRPTGELGYKLNAKVGENDRQNYGVVLNLPEWNGFSTKLYGFSKQADLGAELETGGSEDGQDWLSYGASVLWEPTDTFSAQLTFDRVDDSSNYERQINLTVPGELICDVFGPAVGGDPSSCYAGNYLVQKADDFKTSFGDPAFPFESSMDSWSGILELNNDFGDISLTSLTAYMDLKDKLVEPNVGARPLAPGFGSDLFTADRDQDYFQFSQELRFVSDFQGDWNFVAGLYYMRSQYKLDGNGPPLVPDTPTASGSPSASIYFVGIPAGVFKSKQDLDAFAAFGEVYWSATERINVTAGMRWSYEKKNFFMDRWAFTPVTFDPLTGITSPVYVFDDDDSWDEPTWRLAVDYRFTEDLMGYVSYAKGFRSGGFDGRATTLAQLQNPFDPETLDSYEIGMRSEWWDNRIRFNPTVFYMEYDDKQEERLLPFIGAGGVPETVTVTSNAAEATIWGIEGELTANPIENLVVRASVGYLDADFDKFEDLDGSGNIVDISNTAKLRRTPEWTYNIGADYYWTIGPGTLIASFNHSYTDEYFTSPVRLAEDPLGRDTAEDYDQTDFFLTYEWLVSEDSGTTLTTTAYVKDAFGDDMRSTGAVSAGIFFFGQRRVGQEWGLEFTLEM